MNQTKKRLSIINLAISIGDTETIQLQILKLSPLKSDEKIQEILHRLQAENYAQTQALITDYIENAPDEIIQRTSQHESLSPEEEEEIIEEFDLFRVKPEKEEEIEEILDLEPFDETSEQETAQQKADYDALLNLKSEDILPDNISIEKKTLVQQDDFFDRQEENTPYNYTEVIEQDDFFSDTEGEKNATADEALDELDDMLWNGGERGNHTEEALTKERQSLSEETPTIVPPIKQEISQEPRPQSNTPSAKEGHNKKEENLSALDTLKKKQREEPSKYEPITYIDQKLKNMVTQYPPLEMPEGSYASVDAWLMKISNEGYTEKEVEEMMGYIRKLGEKGEKAEAAQLLLISAATQSKFAQFMLARSLFKGDLLEKNLPEAFTLINRLAMDDDYAEAICDLAQLYEYGIGIDKDKKRAEALYKEAMELGIKRAQAHYERLSSANRGLLGRIFGAK
ncbi:MAG: sel1 repeat family protein [Sulfurovum sp.]|nr:sel1 repeat family protein [Sulfurovum sp.]